MSFISTAVLAFSMSADAFAVALSKGAAIRKPKILDAIRAGAVFGIVETITPLIGWLAGLAASEYISAIDHWVAFVILGAVGSKMLYESFSERHEETKTKFGSLLLLVASAIGTSIDAMAVGVSLAFLDINIWIVASSIGMATFVMATVGIMAGHYIGSRFGRIAEGLGGLAIIIIGTTILLEHTGILSL